MSMQQLGRSTNPFRVSFGAIVFTLFAPLVGIAAILMGLVDALNQDGIFLWHVWNNLRLLTVLFVFGVWEKLGMVVSEPSLDVDDSGAPKAR